MKREDYLKDYYQTLEEAPLNVLEEHKGNTLAAIEDYQTEGDEKKVKELQKDLIKLGELMEKRREK
jgi:hypothetical protein